VVSVTVSAARALAERGASEIAAIVWPEVAQALNLDVAKMPPVRVVKERRATFLASAAQIARRPGPETRFRNLMLAGDYTDTGLPATIEGAIRSGRAAAKLVLRAR
ncbi:MAG TPA: FAD-dependent oxidoreductase, partial [Aestuariivirgaceae bacterium]|nr:FAD-dependent oxidoreductase [Aestuariivirgaceae bacterium]